VIFVDTSAIYAWVDAADPNHDAAVERLQSLVDREEDLLTHNYVLTESIALIQSRLGLAAAARFAADSRLFVVEWVDERLHDEAVAALVEARKRSVSLVDHTSFLVMRRRRVKTVFAFDADFTSAGFDLFAV
jgi:uncharacterized protein